PEAARSELSEALANLALELPQLERPRRGARVDMQRSVPAQPCRPGVGGHRIAHDPRPQLDELGHRPRRSEPTELAANRLPDAVHQAARLVPSCACSTSIVWAGSPGSALRLALVTSACPPAR